MLKGADTDELAARGDSSASGHQTLLISYHGKTFCYRASDCIDGKPEEENSPNGSYRYTHKKYVCELFLITHIHIIRGERKASLPLRKVVMQESGYPEPAHFRFADRTNWWLCFQKQSALRRVFENIPQRERKGKHCEHHQRFPNGPAPILVTHHAYPIPARPTSLSAPQAALLRST